MKKLIPKFFKFLSFISPYLAAKLAIKLFTHPQRKNREDEEMAFLATGKKLHFKSGRKARSWGSGEVIWLIHGWESRGSTFYKLIPLLVNNGYQVIAWDGPAHGDSPGSATHVPNFAHSLVEDLQQRLSKPPVAFVGHSFGGATMAVLNKIYSMPKKVVIVSAPTRIRAIFMNFAKMIGLSSKATAKFIQLSENQSGYSLNEVSLVNNDISKTSNVLIIHDKSDDVIPYSDFTTLKQTWLGGNFSTTENLGHRLTIKDAKVLDTIVDFIGQ